MRYALAIDLGASSGRHILGHQENGEWKMEEVYRFPNGFSLRNGHDCWDTDALFHHILEGMKRCAEIGKIPSSVAIDTWGVDYVLLDEENRRVGDAIAYRDARTQGMDSLLERKMPFPEHYARTGIAKQPFNTIYQLMADYREHLELKSQNLKLIFMPCYLAGLLCGKMRNEYSIASTSGLMNAVTRDWDDQVLSAADIPRSLLGEKPVRPGTVLGQLLPEVALTVGFDCQVVLPACHDTASAFFAVPVKTPGTVYLSSGTWSLLGTVLPQPVLTREAMEAGFTNEGGVDGIRFLQNIMGLWILQCIRREWDNRFSPAELAAMAESGADYRGVINVIDSCFLNPPSMIEAIKSALLKSGEPLPKNDAQLLFCVHYSLAVCYADAVRHLRQITGQTFGTLNIVGGGSNNQLLNRLTMEETGLPVIAGPTEATALGNLMIQMDAQHE